MLGVRERRGAPRMKLNECQAGATVLVEAVVVGPLSRIFPVGDDDRITLRFPGSDAVVALDPNTEVESR